MAPNPSREEPMGYTRLDHPLGKELDPGCIPLTAAWQRTKGAAAGSGEAGGRCCKHPGKPSAESGDCEVERRVYSQDLHRCRPDGVPIVRGEPYMSPHQ